MATQVMEQASKAATRVEVKMAVALVAKETAEGSTAMETL